jgi:hypothetical protein
MMTTTPLKSARRQVFECDDLVAFILGFVGDRHKVAVLSRVNKTFHRMCLDPASWKFGSDGFIMMKPTHERLRLLRAVHVSWSGATSDIPRNWPLCCPQLKVIRGRIFAEMITSVPFSVCLDVFKQLTECTNFGHPHIGDLVAATPANGMRTLTAYGVEFQSTITLSQLPNLTDLDFGTSTPSDLPAEAKLIEGLRRFVAKPLTPVSWLKRFTSTTNSAMRELHLAAYLGGFISAQLEDVGRACPNLTVLRLSGSHLFRVDTLLALARSTPLLEEFYGFIEWAHADIDEMGTPIGVWPLLTSLQLSAPSSWSDNGRCAAFLRMGYLLSAATTLRTLTLHGLSSTHDDVARAIASACGALTSLTITSVGNSSCDGAEMMLAAVGAHLHTLYMPGARVMSIARYCPSLRALTARAMSEADVTSIARGCPVLAKLYLLSYPMIFTIDEDGEDKGTCAAAFLQMSELQECTAGTYTRQRKCI